MNTSRAFALTAALLCISLSACGKKAEKPAEKAADPKAVGAQKAAEGGAEGAKADKVAADSPGAVAAAEAEAKAMDSKTRIAKSRELVDQMAVKMKSMVEEVEAAAGDKTKIQAISDKFRSFAESHRVQGEALSKAMNEAEKKEVAAYAKTALAPLMSRMMAELMKAMAPAGGAAQAAAAPAPGGDKPVEPAGAPPAGEAPTAAPAAPKAEQEVK